LCAASKKRHLSDISKKKQVRTSRLTFSQKKNPDVPSYLDTSGFSLVFVAEMGECHSCTQQVCPCGGNYQPSYHPSKMFTQHDPFGINLSPRNLQQYLSLKKHVLILLTNSMFLTPPVF